MTIDDYYIINTGFDGKNIDLTPEGFSFSMADSIYSLYNYGAFELNDMTGLFQEFLATSEGAEIEIGFGTKEILNTCKYAVKKDELNEVLVPGYLSGYVEIELVNAWYNSQQIRSKAYQATIASIISKLVQNKGFSSIDIEDTGNKDLWYQMMTTDANFIQNMLLPNAYSVSSETPFYAYITHDNVFHLKSLQQMLTAKPIATIEYKSASAHNITEDMTINIRRFHQSSDEHRALLKRKVFQISRNNGQLVEKPDDGIDQYPRKNLKSVPILNFHDEATGYVDMGFSETDTGRDENNKGQRINSTRKSAIVDRFLIIQPLNPALKSGNSVQFNVNIASDDGEKLSARYAGTYIIENSEHIWNHREHKAFTKIMIGRKYTGIVPDTYLLKPDLI